MSAPPAARPAVRPAGKGVPPPRKAPPPKAGKGPPAGTVAGPKLRPLFWSAVPKVPAASVWEELTPAAPFDPSQLEKHFSLAQPRAPAMTKTSSVGEEMQKKRLRFLDDKASQLLAIAFSRLPGPEWLASVLRTLDKFLDCLPPEAVLALHAAASDQASAMQQLKQYGQQDVAQLDMPERYLWVLGSVPDSLAKLACAAVIMGPARELPDLCADGDLVAACCHEFRQSKLVRRCVSTSLVVGNAMNRGTNRGNAKAILLPDSLLKFEELRGAQDADMPEAQPSGLLSGQAATRRSTSLLDIVAQALVDEPGSPTAHEMRAEANILLARTVAAKSVSLEEADLQCQKICEAAANAKQGIMAIAQVEDIAALTERVQVVCAGAQTTSQRIAVAKQELASTQQWSSAKQNLTGEEWFSSWAQFFEHFALALGRTRTSRPLSSLPIAVAPASVPMATSSGEAVLGAAVAIRAAVPEAPLAQPLGAAESAGRQSTASTGSKVVVPQAIALDDNARAEDMLALFGKLKAGAALHSSTAVVTMGADKENMRLG